MNGRYAKILRVIELYYKENLTQQEISKILGISRPTVSRLLDEARENNIVKIQIDIPLKIDSDLSCKLRKKLKLRDCVVVDCDEIDTLPQIAKEAVNYIQGIIKENSIIGLSFGRSVKSVVEQMPKMTMKNVCITQIMGSVSSSNTHIDGIDLVKELANKMQAKSYVLNAPGLLSSVAMAREIRKQPLIQETMMISKKADIYISSVGCFEHFQSSLELLGYLNQDEIIKLKQQNAVGHVWGKIIDIDGKQHFDVNQRVISLDSRDIPINAHSICVAASAEKAEALLGSILAGFFNVIIIDRACALKLYSLIS